MWDERHIEGLAFMDSYAPPTARWSTPPTLNICIKQNTPCPGRCALCSFLSAFTRLHKHSWVPISLNLMILVATSRISRYPVKSLA
ncbi:hypothetical protein MUK42_30961, partial [Musa troglodytarum]